MSRSVIGIAVLVAVGIVALLAYCRPHPAPLPQKEQHSLDSLVITKPFYQAERQQLVTKETVYVAASAKAERSASVSQHSADSLHRIADSLQHAAESLHDTTGPNAAAAAWEATAIARGHEADSLRTANVDLTSALEQQKLARLQANMRSAKDSARVVALNDLNGRLAHDVAHVGECRLLPFVRCPTRVETALGFIVIGAVAQHQAAQLLKR